MCNHSYIAEHFKQHRSIGKRCPYPDLFEKLRSISGSATETELAVALPVDDGGACIFHSQDSAWKRKNNFTGNFLQLVRFLDEAEGPTDYDFAEFVFVGSEMRTNRGSEEHFLPITDMTFRNQAYFTGASFLDSTVLEGINFQDGASFNHATFARDLNIDNTVFRGIDFTAAKCTHLAFFNKVEFLSFALFANAHFISTKGGDVRFQDSRFEGITEFSDAVFDLGDEGSVSFKKVKFEDFTDFKGTQFNCQVAFNDVSFGYQTEFIDTSFDTIRSSARYRGSAVEFNRIEVTSKAVLTFMSTDPQNKMFNHDVQMSFKDDPTGTIRFENVNFSRIGVSARDRLSQLAKLGRVEIGSGCIKYRFQTEIRTISISQGNAPLVLELCQTFSNYFTVNNGLNLGFEIVERGKTKISFFYFTDEDILEQTFRDRLAQTEESLWNLLSIRSSDQALALAGSTSTALSTDKQSAVINAVDGVSALLGTFFRVGTRIALGAWKEPDTRALLSAIRFNEEGADNRALNLHRVLTDKYTGSSLFGFNRQQNAQLFLEGQVSALSQTVKLLAEKGDTYHLGDNYEVSGQAGAVGPRALTHNMSFNQIVAQFEESVDLSELAEELSRLRQAMSQEAKETEQYISLGDVAKAEQAAKGKDASKVVESLKSAGKWAFDVSTKIGVSLVSEALKQSMGIK